MVSTNKKIEELLIGFGFTRDETKIYLTLLQTGRNSVLEISKKTGIKRSTAHNYIGSLIEKGIIGQTNYGGRRYIVAEPPEKLQFILEQKRYELKRLEENLTETINAINEIVPNVNEGNDVEMKYYQGKNGFREVCQRSLDLSDKEILFISNLDEWHKVYTLEYDRDHYIPTRLKKGINLKMLVFKSDTTIDMKKYDEESLRETRFLPDGFLFKSTIIMYANEVSIMISSEPYLAIIIKNTEVHKMFCAIFNDLWKRG